jgi:hypothetical protein
MTTKAAKLTKHPTQVKQAPVGPDIAQNRAQNCFTLPPHFKLRH